MEKSNESAPEAPTKLSTPDVPVNVWELDEAPALLTRIVEVPTVVDSGENTLTCKPSIPSAIESAIAVTEKVADVEPAGIVTVPDCASISVAVALSTVEPLSLPIAVHVKMYQLQQQNLQLQCI